jgi:hypothetical protein
VLSFVDLAGSEKLSSHEPLNDSEYSASRHESRVKERITEGKNINKSLFFLTQVIQMRAAQRKRA